jgi:dipeptidyl aminopeptidase/acylaminoacyl peptidase
VGASYGGYAAMRAAQRDGQHYRCAVSYAGVADIPGMQRYDGGFLNGSTRREMWKDTGDDLKRISPINGAAEFSIPLLLMHGKKDLRVPVAQSREMAERLRKAGKTAKYIEQPDGDHHFSRAADRLQFLTEMKAFLVQYNPVEAQ